MRASLATAAGNASFDAPGRHQLARTAAKQVCHLPLLLLGLAVSDALRV